MNCVLCDSLRDEPGRILYKDDHVFVLINIEPLKEGHVIILPVRHAEQLGDLTPDESSAFLKAIDRCMHAVTEAYDAPMCLVNGQKYRSQAHLHAHVLPSKNGLRGLYTAAEGLEHRKRADDDVLDRIKETLKPYFG